MSMNISAYNQNPYSLYSNYRQRDVLSRDEIDREEDQAIALSEELASSAVPAQPVDTQEPKQRIVEDASEADSLRQDNMNSRYSSAQMDLMDIQAAFFGFSSRRTSDIQPVSM